MSKTIETRLQSNEVRIPKKSTEFDLTAPAASSQYFKSSFARSLSFSQGPGGPGGGPYGSAEQHFTRSLDFDVNFDPTGGGGGVGGGLSNLHQMTPSSASPVYEEEHEGGSSRAENGSDHELVSLNGMTGIEASNGGIVKTLWNYAKGQEVKSASSSPAKMLKSNGTSRKSIEGNEIEVLRLRKECQNLIEENRRLVSIATAAGGGGNGLGGGMLGGVGSGSGSLSTLGMGVPNGGNYTSVESVILQTQVETLQWQLKQVDSSRHMYRAVMEEVVRFLDRCYRSLDALQSGQIGRSKSVLQVSKTSNGTQHNHNHHSNNHHHHHDSDSSSASSPRARSSTNLVDVHQKTYTKATNGRLDQQSQHQNQQQHQQKQQHQPSSLTLINSSPTSSQHGAPSTHPEDDCAVPPSPASSYSTFRDFTWRRSPKRTQTLPISSNEVDPEKLAQEAFRLLRTVQNLLNTQEPTLAQSTNALDSLISASTAASSCGSSTTLTGVGLSGASGAVLGSTPTLTGNGSMGGGGAGGVGGGNGGTLVNTRSNVGFNRKMNMRGSRLSVRSSTADSVHSTSSSTKTETDEDNTDRPSPPLILAHHHLLHHQSNGVGGGGANGGTVGGGGGGGSSSSSCSSSTSGNGSITGSSGHHHHHHNPAHRYSANIERIKEMMISSSAEDESGFSSMNSFQEIGLPLVNSTMLSSVGSSHGVSNGSLGGGSSSSTDGGSSSNSGVTGGGTNTFGVSDDSSELRENTVIPTTLNGGGHSGNGSVNKLGIPASPAKASSTVSSVSNGGSMTAAANTTTTNATAPNGSPLRVTQTASYEHHTHFVNHRRWDSAPVVPPKLKIHASETDTVSRVLWV